MAALVTGVACVTGLTGIDPAVAGPVTGPLSDIVFGNLGASGTNALTTTGHLIESPRFDEELVSRSVAMAFTTGSEGPWQLGDLLRVGMGNPVNSPAPFALILKDDAGNPSSGDNEGDVLAVYNLGEEGVTTTGLYDFTRVFADPLEASTTYWLIVADDTPEPEPSSFDWYDNAAYASPDAQNDSGWAFVGTKISVDFGATWQPYSAGQTAAFSIAVVPEPATSCMVLAGLAGCGYVAWRRCRRGFRSPSTSSPIWEPVRAPPTPRSA